VQVATNIRSKEAYLLFYQRRPAATAAAAAVTTKRGSTVKPNKKYS
jgi:hypothetical protein